MRSKVDCGLKSLTSSVYVSSVHRRSRHSVVFPCCSGYRDSDVFRLLLPVGVKQVIYILSSDLLCL